MTFICPDVNQAYTLLIIKLWIDEMWHVNAPIFISLCGNHIPVCHSFYEDRTVFFDCIFTWCLSNLIHCQSVISVYSNSSNTITWTMASNSISSILLVGWCRDGITIVTTETTYKICWLTAGFMFLNLSVLRDCWIEMITQHLKHAWPGRCSPCVSSRRDVRVISPLLQQLESELNGWWTELNLLENVYSQGQFFITIANGLDIY